MHNQIIAVLVLLLIASLIGFVYNSKNASNNSNLTDTTTTTTLARKNITLPACIVDLDCGAGNDTGYICWKDFIVWDYTSYQCLEMANGTAYCNQSVEREVIDWCRPNERCVTGKKKCQPGISCHDGIQNQNETGRDCGGPCPPCPSCYDKVMNGDEKGVDCGGVCGSCVVYCTSDDSCGIPRWGLTFCEKDSTGYAHVYQDYFSYECRNPGKKTSFCKRNVIRRLTDYCGPQNPCIRGVCWDDADSPYAYKDGGYWGDTRPSLTDQYKCKKGDNCWDQNRAYRTCIGDDCMLVAIPDN